jgi:hypothetical protein
LNRIPGMRYVPPAGAAVPAPEPPAPPAEPEAEAHAE